MKSNLTKILSLVFILLISTTSFADSPSSYQLKCSDNMYEVGLNPGYGGKVSVDLVSFIDYAPLTYGGGRGDGTTVYRGVSDRNASFQVILWDSLPPRVTIYQDNVFPARFLATLNCRRWH